MATEPDPVALSSGNRRTNTPVTETAVQADGAIAFRERLLGEMNSTAASTTAPVKGDTGAGNAIPLYERLYGSQATIPSVTVGAYDQASSASPAVLRKIQSFANAIRTPASIAALELGTTTNTVIAFAGLETGWGQHIPGQGAESSNNLFGIKAHGDNHPSISNTTTEYIEGEAQTFHQQFRSYQSIGESIADFSHFLRSNPRYNEALTQAGNPRQFIKLVHEAGYATDPDYANKVISALNQLDNITTKTGALGIGWR